MKRMIRGLMVGIALLTLGDWRCEGEIIPEFRRIDWDPGSRGASDQERRVFCDATALIPGSSLLAKGDGVTDDSAAIQAAIDECPDGEVVYLPEGTYRIEETLTVKRTVLRGAGPDKTILDMVSSSVDFYPKPGFFRSYSIAGVGEDMDPAPGSAVSLSSIIRQYDQGRIDSGSTVMLPRGTRSLVVDESPQFLEEGDMMLVNQLNDGDLVDPDGQEGSWRRVSSRVDRNLGQWVEVDSVEELSSGQYRIRFNPGLHWEYFSNLDPQIYYPSFNNHSAGMEDLAVQSNDRRGATLTRLHMTKECWITNCRFSWSFNTAIYVRDAFRCEIRDCWFEGTEYDTPGGGYGIRMDLDPTDNLVENNVIVGLRSPIIISGGSGNVFGYNYTGYLVNFDDRILQKNASIHAVYPKMNLFEGNVMTRAGADNTHGSSGFNTFFRNWCVGRSFEPRAQSWSTSYNWPTTVDSKARYMNYVGNILGWPGMDGVYERDGVARSASESIIWPLGFTRDGDMDPAGNDPLVGETLLRHGNFDFVTQSTVWESDIEDRTLPASLYLSEKPDFFGDEIWPPIGPDVVGMVTRIPAERRFVDQARPEAPSNLRVID